MLLRNAPVRRFNAGKLMVKYSFTWNGCSQNSEVLVKAAMSIYG
jgi:hypothetical protein